MRIARTSAGLLALIIMVGSASCASSGITASDIPISGADDVATSTVLETENSSGPNGDPVEMPSPAAAVNNPFSAGTQPQPAPESSSTTTAVAAPAASLAPAIATSNPAASTTVPAPPPPPPSADGSGVYATQGDSGPHVLALQETLKANRFDPGAVDGQYGAGTTQAVWAFKKLSGQPIDSALTNAEFADLADGWAPPPARTDVGATRTEIDLTKQTLVMYRDNAVALITHVSSGSGVRYCDPAKSRDPDRPDPTVKGGKPKIVCGSATTPTGTYRYGRREHGWYRSELGTLLNPVFFNGGIAVHGANSVPAKPASHGCVRIPVHIANYFQSLVNTGEAVVVYRS